MLNQKRGTERKRDEKNDDTVHAVPWKIHGNQIFENFFPLFLVEHEEIITSIHAKDLNGNRTQLVITF